MKKLIAILAVFAVVAPALFAQDQGSWSVGGAGEIGTRLNFTPWEYRDDPVDYPNSDQTVVTVQATRYTNLWDGWGQVFGGLDLNYSRGGLRLGLSFNTGDPLGASLTYSGNSFNFGVSQNVRDLLGVLGGMYFNLDVDGVLEEIVKGEDDPNKLLNQLFDVGMWSRGYNPGRLWGDFSFLDGLLFIEAAVDSKDLQYWSTATFIDNSIAKVDHHNYLLLNAKPIPGFEVGFMLPGVFTMNVASGNWRGSSSHEGVRGAPGGSYNFVKESLERTIFGVKYATGPFGVAVQYALDARPIVFNDEDIRVTDTAFLNSKLYAGATYNLNDQMQAQLQLLSNFFKSEDNVNRINLRMGGRFGYAAGPLEVRLDAIYMNDVNSGFRTAGGSEKVENGVIRLRPYVRYDIVPTHLRFKMDTIFDFFPGEYTLIDNEEGFFRPRTVEERYRSQRTPALAYRVIPELWFNFLGNGASDNYWGGFTGLIARYGIQGRVRDALYMEGLAEEGDEFNIRHANDPSTHAFELIFKWSF